MKFRRSNKSLPILVQVKAMSELFPNFSVVQRSHRHAVWEGKLQPNEEMDEHTIRIEYELGKHPKVYAPTWKQKCRHKFKDNSLCLYFKNRENWNPKKLIAKTIVPWSSQWLLFNEFYNITGDFGALEVNH